MSPYNDQIDVHKIRKIISFNKNLIRAQKSLRRKVSEEKMIQCMNQLLSYPIILIEKLNSMYITSKDWFLYRSSCIEDNNSTTLNHSFFLLEEIDSKIESDFSHQNITILENELELNKNFEEKLRLLEESNVDNTDNNNSCTPIMSSDSSTTSSSINNNELNSTEINVIKTSIQSISTF